MRSVIIKWIKYGTAVTLTRTACPSQIYERKEAKREFCQEAHSKIEAAVGISSNYSLFTISHPIYISGLWGRVVKRNPYLTKEKKCTHLKCVTVWWNQSWHFWPWFQNLHCSSSKQHRTSNEFPMVVSASCFKAVYHQLELGILWTVPNCTQCFRKPFRVLLEIKKKSDLLRGTFNGGSCMLTEFECPSILCKACPHSDQVCSRLSRLTFQERQRDTLDWMPAIQRSSQPLVFLDGLPSK